MLPCDTEVFTEDYLHWPTFRDLLIDLYKLLGRGGLIAETAEVPKTKSTQKHGGTLWFFARRAEVFIKPNLT